MKPVLIFGAGGHAKVVVDVLEKQGNYRVLGLIGPERPQAQGRYPYLGREEDLPRQNSRSGIIAVGDNNLRQKIVRTILELCPDFEFVTAVHPSVQLAGEVSLGQGTVVMAGAVINPEVQIGQHCIVNTGSLVDHECRIGDFASLAPGSVLGGQVNVGALSAVGLGAKVIQKIQIGSRSIIGAGSCVVRDIPDGVVAYGIPCKVRRPLSG